MKEGLDIENGNKLRDDGLDLPAEYSIYQWDGVTHPDNDGALNISPNKYKLDGMFAVRLQYK